MKNFVKKATSLKAAIAAGIMAPVTMTAVVAPAPAQAQDVGDILGDIVEGVTRDAARDLRRAPREARREAQRERREVRRVDQYVGREAADGDIPLGAIPAIRQCAYSLTIQYNFRARDAVESCVNEYNRQRAARYTPRR